MSTPPLPPGPPARPAYEPPPQAPRPVLPTDPRGMDRRTDARPPLPWWVVVLTVLGVLLVGAVLAVAVASALQQAATRTATTAVQETGVDEVRITGVTGGATITTDGAAPGTVDGEARTTAAWQDAEVTVERQGDVLLLEASCPGGSWPRRCEVAYDLVVDPSTDVVVDIVTGGVRADSVSGDVDVDVTTGGVVLTESGSATVDVDVTSGGVALEFVEPPTDVRVATATGGIAIALPDDGESYAVQTAVSVGGSQVDVPTDPTSQRTVVATTSIGGIDVSHGTDVPDGRAGRPGRPGG